MREVVKSYADSGITLMTTGWGRLLKESTMKYVFGDGGYTLIEGNYAEIPSVKLTEKMFKKSAKMGMFRLIRHVEIYFIIILCLLRRARNFWIYRF